MAALIGVAGLAFSAYGSSKSKSAAKEAGREGQIAKEFEAKQLERQAVASLGSAQRTMLAERRRKELVVSRAQALAAFGGGGVSDPTVQNIVSDIEGEGAYREAIALYQGEDEARKLNESAYLSRKEGAVIRRGGQAQARAYQAQGISTALQGASSLYTKYSQSQTNATTAGRNSTLASGTTLNT